MNHPIRCRLFWKQWSALVLTALWHDPHALAGSGLSEFGRCVFSFFAWYTLVSMLADFILLHSQRREAP